MGSSRLDPGDDRPSPVVMPWVAEKASLNWTPRPVLSGVYHDRWHKTQQGWQITQRILRHDHHTPYLSQ